MCYGLQHYLSLAGSLIFIPLIIIPAMGGSDVSISFCNLLCLWAFANIWCLNISLYSWVWCNVRRKFTLFSLLCIYFTWVIQKDTATVISTMLLVSGVTTILHSYFGTRLPLVQGSSFVYLAPALVIMNSRDFRNLTEHVSSKTN